MPGHRPLDFGGASRLIAAVAGLAVGLLLNGTAANAVPAFAVQTGAPCQSCHVGGFGPQLTPFGRNFKLHGYTARAGDSYNLPVSMMAEASYVSTNKPQAAPPAPYFGTNDNLGLDQVSLFIAGGLGEHLGAFIQNTYDGIGRSWSWDNTDIRAVFDTTIAKADVLLGLSVNNNPTVQDAWNSTPAWGYPYSGSALAPGGPAAPLLQGGLAQNSVGLTGYAWINSKVFLEAGGYVSPGSKLVSRLGADPTSPGNIKGIAPYGRATYQTDLWGGTAEVGAAAIDAIVEPGLDASSGATDRYRDLAIDASFYRAFDNGDTFTLNTALTQEKQNLDASYFLGNSGNQKNNLTDLRADAAYFWKNRVGVTVQGFNTTGTPDALLYASDRTLKPDTSGLMAELSATPWGAGTSPFGPRMNMRLGVQYTYYLKFNGARDNTDGAGAKASDNNTLRLYAWFAY